LCLEKKSKAVTVTSNRFQDLSTEDEEEIDETSKETWPTPKESKDGKILNKGGGGKSKGKGKSNDKHMDMLQATRKAVWKRFGKEERWEMEPPVRDENVSFPRRDTGSDLRVKRVRFCEAEPMQIPFPPAQKRIYDNGKKRIPRNEFPAVAHMVCDEKQQITIEVNAKASKHVRRAQLDIESGDEGIEDFGFGSESDEEATAVLPTRKMFDGSRGLREAPRSRQRFTNSAAVNGVSINSDVDNDTVQINAVAGAGTKWSSKASIRFNVADVQRPLASASEVVAKVNRIVLEEGGSFIQNVSTGEKIALRVERGVYVFDAKYGDGSTGTMALDSGAGVNVWPQDWKIDAPMEPKAPGLRMVAANGTEIANLGQKVIKFNAIQPFAKQR